MSADREQAAEAVAKADEGDRATACQAKPTAPVRKAVILARGLGTRMRAAAQEVSLSDSQSAAAAAGTKGLIDVGRPFMDYLISGLADVGITDICLVIGPEHDAFRSYYQALAPTRVTIHYAIQQRPLGTADAVSAARDFVGTDRFVVLNSDNYYPVEALSRLVACPGNGVIGFQREALVAQSNIPAERIDQFAIIRVEDGNLADIIEKPDAQQMADNPGAPLSMNCWLFTPAVLDHCDAVTPSPRGELELVDAVRTLAAAEPFPVIPATCGVLDLSRREDIPAVAEALKDRTVLL